MTTTPRWYEKLLHIPQPCLTYSECDKGAYRKLAYITRWTCLHYPHWYRVLYFRYIRPDLKDYLIDG